MSGECGSYDGELGDGEFGSMGLGNSSASDDDNCGMRVEGRERSAVGRQAGADQAMGSSIAANLVAWGSTTAPTLMTAACGWKGGTGRR